MVAKQALIFRGDEGLAPAIITSLVHTLSHKLLIPSTSISTLWLVLLGAGQYGYHKQHHDTGSARSTRLGHYRVPGQHSPFVLAP